MSTLPERWVALYTRGLPDETRGARCDEIASDVFEQQASNGAGPLGLRISIAGRTLRGVPGDLMWRFEEGRAMNQERRAPSGRPTGIRAAWATATQSWFTPLAVLVGVFNVVGAIFVLVDEDGKMPGQVIGPILLCLFSAAMFTGLWLRWRSQFDADIAPVLTGNPARRSAIALRVLAVVAVVLIALGLIGSIVALLGGALTLVAIAIVAARRRGQVAPIDTGSPTAQSVVLADVLIVVATLPALGMFWTVVPPIVAVVVIGGVLGTGRGARRAATA